MLQVSNTSTYLCAAALQHIDRTICFCDQVQCAQRDMCLTCVACTAIGMQRQGCALAWLAQSAQGLVMNHMGSYSRAAMCHQAVEANKISSIPHCLGIICRFMEMVGANAHSCAFRTDQFHKPARNVKTRKDQADVNVTM